MSASQRISELERQTLALNARMSSSAAQDTSVFEDSLDEGSFRNALRGSKRLSPGRPNRSASPQATNMGGSVESRSSPGSIRGSPSNRAVSPTNQGRGSPGRERMIQGMMDDADKDVTIRNLREEIERLKGKVNTIVHSAETSLEEAIESQEAMRNELHSKVAREQQKYQHIIAENAALKEVILSLNEELISERQHVEKAVRFMDRIKHNVFIGTAEKNKLHSLTGSFSHNQKLHHT